MTVRAIARFVPLVWLLLLFAPALTVYSSVNAWDFAPYSLLCVSGWVIGGSRLLLPATAFYWASLPFQWLGIVATTSSLLRNVDVLELALMLRTFPSTQIESALAPYLLPASGLAVALGVLAHLSARVDTSPPPLARRRSAAILLALGCGLALWIPGLLWLRAWPLNAVAVAVASASGSSALDSLLFPENSLSNPRPADEDWRATRVPVAGEVTRETFVLVIGESVRADALRECGAPAAMPRMTSDALVACNVTAGSDATHTSVPLMVSRDLPGLQRRVPADATFLKAFERVGFHTYWLASQDATIAWPDAQTVQAVSAPGLDADVLNAPFDVMLADPHPRRAIVLHTQDAHSPYCDRISQHVAQPFTNACARLGNLPTADTLADWKAVYGNAVSTSMSFLGGVIARLEREPGAVFLIYSPDHGEALLDDHRQIYGHAMRHPTRWDVQVPAIFWANAAWRKAHPEAWRHLKANLTAPLMHADLVPTLLGAAGIRYQDGRRGVFDLTSTEVPAERSRVVQRSLGKTATWDQLVEEAR